MGQILAKHMQLLHSFPRPFHKCQAVDLTKRQNSHVIATVIVYGALSNVNNFN
jgi:hypothetical protein